MRLRYIFVIIAVLIFLVVGLYFFYENEKISSSSNNNPYLKDTNITPGILPDNTRTKSKVRDKTPGKETYCKILGRNGSALQIKRKDIEARIQQGLITKEIATKILPDEKIDTIEDAYKRLIHGSIFINSDYPIWGVENELYFVFSGFQNTPKDLVFKNGYAIKKDTGEIYLYANIATDLDK